jgi:hypothetical protein
MVAAKSYEQRGGTLAPDLVALPEGRFRARCQFCKRESIPIPAVDAAGAWRAFLALGWVTYETVRGAFPSALCKACGAKHERIMASARTARKGRKRT